MDDGTWFAEQFEANRPHLRAVAYRMLGSLTEADDALQDAWLRTTRADSRTITNIGGWLTTLVGRVCIDMLRARQSRRESLTGSWLPEPVVSTYGSFEPEQSVLLADAVGVALLVVLESLTPAERLAFVLHDMFAVPFDEIGPIVGRTPEATRQLASRARRRVRGAGTQPDADLPTQRRVVGAFLAAARAGEFEELIKLLDPDVVFRADTGSRTWLAPAHLRGATEVARHTSTHGPRFATHCHPAVVNGAAGVIARAGADLVAVVGFTVVDGRIVEIDLLLDEDKIAGLTISG
ncbi:RNA polymerase sigma factor SigJ [Asanoa sp. NPDC049573]|uniref:RNA polymerase sigma factor SigJ n=1 Tax=Asanoa sp. NPDC049573 TaxID=3155396 RepID=UPI003422C997